MISALFAAVAWWRIPAAAAALLTLYFAFFLANTASYFYTTRRGKFLAWERILDRIPLRGGEMVLDMGFGRGAVLTAVRTQAGHRPGDRCRYLEHGGPVGGMRRTLPSGIRRSQA